MYRQHQNGALLVLVLVFGAIFFIMVTTFMGFVITQNRVQQQKIQSEKSLAIAEAGLNYYKWRLAHYPDDMTNGTGMTGPYDVPYEDFENGLVGTSTIGVDPVDMCDERTSILLESTGVASGTPTVARTVWARYAQPSIAEFSYVINSDVWAGSSRVISGPYHSNGGVRMDGENRSTVSSGVPTWNCTSSFGCSPEQSNADGVVGDGLNSDLWEWPVMEVDYSRLSIDLQSMLDNAQAQGHHIAPSGREGYRIRFNSNGTYDLFRVIQSQNEPRSDEQQHLNRIRSAQYIGNFTPNPECPLIFVEDKLWIEGVVSGKMTVAASSAVPGIDHSIILNDNITYRDDDSALMAVAEKNILVGLDVPNNMEINGIFVAINGHFGRNNYSWISSSSSFRHFIFRDSLTINGTIVSNGRVGTQWVYTSGAVASGFLDRTSSYDRRLVTDPPPLTPKISDNYQFIEWRQE